MKNDFFFLKALDIFIDHYLTLLENCIFHSPCGLDVTFANTAHAKTIKMTAFILSSGQR